jgi:hypothetical protein
MIARRGMNAPVPSQTEDSLRKAVDILTLLGATIARANAHAAQLHELGIDVEFHAGPQHTGYRDELAFIFRGVVDPSRKELAR